MKKTMLIKLLITLLAAAAGIGVTFTSCRSALFDASFSIDSLFLYGSEGKSVTDFSNK